MLIRRLLTVTMIFAVSQVCVAEGAELAVGDEAPKFLLSNANDQPFKLRYPMEKPLFLSFGDQASQGEVDPWREAFDKKYGDQLEYKAVAWLELIPSWMRGAVQKIIKEQYDWVLLDWSGGVAKRYGCKESRANIYVIDRDGTLLVKQHGKMTKAQLNKIYEKLDEVLQAGK